MSIRKRTAQQDTERPRDQDVARLLELLEHDRDGALTVAQLRAPGVAAPAQAIYSLQLAGYDIDRLPADRDGCQRPGYRLHTTAEHLNGGRKS